MAKYCLKNNLLCLITVFLFVLSCKKVKEKNDTSFTFIERGSYKINSANEQNFYFIDRSLMDGYYVVGNELTKWEEFDVEDGLLNGDYIIFHPNGEIYTHSNYIKGKLNGEEKVNYLSGKLMKLKTYKNDVLVGKVVEYYESGQVKSESKIKDGKLIESVSYDIIGNVESQMFIKDGYTFHQKILKGKVFSEQISSNYDNFEAMKFYNEDGSLKVFLRMLDDGDKSYLIELDENRNEIKRIDVKENPEKAMEYAKYFIGL